MKVFDSNFLSHQVTELLNNVSTKYSIDVANSVSNHYGNPNSMSSWELEEMLDDLISKANDD